MNIPIRIVALTLLLAAASLAQTEPSTQPTPASEADFQKSLKSAKPGDIVHSPYLDAAAIPAVAIAITPAPDSPQFLLSDKPEYFRTGDGISMQEEVKPGRVRLYVYHVPEPTGAKKVISAVIENRGDAEMHVKFRHFATAAPGGDYHMIARRVLMIFFADEQDREKTELRIVRTSNDFSVPTGAREAIDDKLDNTEMIKDQLVHGIYDFVIDQPARITIFQKDPSADSLKVIDTLPKLPRVLPGWHASGAGRGLFPVCEYSVTAKDGVIDTSEGPQRILVADGKTDPWIEGRDSLDTTSPIQNKGNYGVMYRMRFEYKSPDNRGVAVLMVGHRPDNKMCKYTAAVIRINDGVHKGGVIALPANAKRFENLPSSVVMQVYPPAPAGETRTIEFTYSPPGACCLPTPVLLVPVD